MLALLLNLLISCALAANGEAPEGLLNKLLAPGPLIEGHKNLEGSRCLECHVPRKGIPDAKCLECHDVIKVAVKKKKGFHGLTAKTCISCHSDHKGREFDSTKIDEKTFDHKLTGYTLEGKHADIKCVDCHVEKRSKAAKGKPVLRPNDPRYTGATTSCVGCHRKDDVHFFKGDWAKKDCDACHGLKSWKEGARFDHDKDTHYKLDGKHAKITCAECHVPKKDKVSIYHWAELKTKDCLLCHVDQHKGKLGKKYQGGNTCVKCHTTETWKLPNFDHSITGYELTGKHEGVDCIKCHKQADAHAKLGSFKFTGLKQDCASCHASPHTKTFSQALQRKACTECHTDRSWKDIRSGEVKFDHKTTRFPLDGAHTKVSCDACHKIEGKEVYKFKSASKEFCIDCHKNVHVDQFDSRHAAKTCTVCHSTKDWDHRKDFDHDKTRLKLTNKHAGLDCVKCHKPTSETFDTKPFHHKTKYYFPELASKDCAACHKDPHKGSFGAACAACHNDKGWKTGSTDFHRDFTLTGAHLTAACAECHVDSRKLGGLSQMCVACHRKDDVHQGRLVDCGSCHKQTFWESTDFRHSLTRFPLKGMHRTLDCVACHAQGIYRGLPNTCASCHVKDALAFTGTPDHRVLLGRSCADCHNEFSFR